MFLLLSILQSIIFRCVCVSVLCEPFCVSHFCIFVLRPSNVEPCTAEYEYSRVRTAEYEQMMQDKDIQVAEVDEKNAQTITPYAAGYCFVCSRILHGMQPEIALYAAGYCTVAAGYCSVCVCVFFCVFAF